ncbi:DUF4124 domain-containing protein [Geomesophilobacter sediminis]|uniref:DUF4124 domain-containing protein n=1 Tax=Geomesophilobacter sediminis TaxID=2798584 RepID=A0A8J7S9L7_9BACT|nr:DUF4124 domain-containing protein [Geomesophilobacter sediminis]MBJ6726910.1 DUF4124 domain-containing protein [Geomesophilobacter sediminis]
MTKVSGSALIFLLLAGLLLLAGSTAFADLYQYTDRNGVVTVTDKLDSVPKKYRATMKVTREEPKAAPQLPTASSVEMGAAQEAAPSAAPPKATADAGRRGWVTPVLVLVGLAAGFFIVLRLTRNLVSAQLAKVIYLVFFLGVSVFLYKSYAEHLVEGTLGMKQKVLGMFKKANARESSALEETRGAAK